MGEPRGIFGRKKRRGVRVCVLGDWRVVVSLMVAEGGFEPPTKGL